MIDEFLNRNEGETLDFKSEQYRFIGEDSKHVKSELLKDILAMANSWGESDRYLLVGVRENRPPPHQIVGIESSEHIDDASIQQFVNEKINKPIRFSYEAVSHGDKSIGKIWIEKQLSERPFYPLRDYGHLKQHDVHIRRSSGTDIAKPEEIARMGRLSTNSIGPEAMTITVEKPDRWELLLLAQLLEDNLALYSQNRLDRELGVSIGSSIPLDTGSAVVEWCKKKLDDLEVLIDANVSLFHGGNFTVTLDSSDKLLAVDRISHLARRFGENYKHTLEWQTEFRRVKTRDEFEPFLKYLARYPDKVIRDTEEYVASMADKIRASPEGSNDQDTANIVLQFSSEICPDAVAGSSKESGVIRALRDNGNFKGDW